MALSDRIRPNVEAALWVIEEVKKLETQNARYREALEAIATANPAPSLVKEFYIDQVYQNMAKKALKGK